MTYLVDLLVRRLLNVALLNKRIATRAQLLSGIVLFPFIAHAGVVLPNSEPERRSTGNPCHVRSTEAILLDAKHLLDRTDSVHDELLARIAHAAATTGDFALADVAVNRMESQEHRSFMQRLVASEMIGVATLRDEAIKRIGRLSKDHDDLPGICAKIAAEADDWTAATRLVELIESPPRRAQWISHLVVVAHRSGEHWRADTLSGQMWDLFDSLDSPLMILDIGCDRILIGDLDGYARITRRVESLRTMVDVGNDDEPDTAVVELHERDAKLRGERDAGFSRVCAVASWCGYSTIRDSAHEEIDDSEIRDLATGRAAMVLAKTGRLEEAISFVDESEILSRDYRPEVYRQVATEYARRNELARAKGVAKRGGAGSELARWLIGTAIAMRDGDSRSSAIDLLDEAAVILAAEPMGFRDIDSQLRLASAYAAVDNTDKAISLLRELSTEDKVRDGATKGKEFISACDRCLEIAEVWCELGREDEARRMMEAVVASWKSERIAGVLGLERDTGLVRMGVHCSRCGAVDLSLTLCEKVESDIIRQEIRERIVYQLASSASGVGYACEIASKSPNVISRMSTELVIWLARQRSARPTPRPVYDERLFDDDWGNE